MLLKDHSFLFHVYFLESHNHDIRNCNIFWYDYEYEGLLSVLKFPWVMRPVLIRLPLSGDLVEAAGQREVLVLVEPQLWRVHYCNVMEGAAIQKAGVIFCTLDHLLFKARPVLHWCCYEWGFALLRLLLHRYDYCCYCDWGRNHVETSAAPLLHDHPLMIRFLILFLKSFDIDHIMWSTYDPLMICFLHLSKSIDIKHI